ncbi:MAG: SdrD B-like domain-containing protein, partial [Actinomycetota bacterium]|nr:SdrD B-like domain-containing protein [Actinomycetota bacterium]
VRVELWPDADGDGAADPGDPAAVTTTDANGHYRLDVPADGDWVVRIPADELAEGGTLGGYVSSTGNGTPADPDDGVDGDDNGAGVLPAPIATAAVTLASGTAPTGEADVAAEGPANPLPDASSDLTVDLAVVAPDGITIGDLVWADVDGSGRLDAGDDEPPLGGVPVELHRDTNGDGRPDDTVAHRVTTTTADGWYRFGEVPQGSWLVSVPEAAFAPGGVAAGWQPTPGRTTEAGVDGDDDAGEPASGGARTGPFTVVAGQAPTGETAPASPSVGAAPVAAVDDRADLTIDVALTRVAVGGLVWADRDGDGRRQPGEPGLAGVPVSVVAGGVGSSSADPVATATTDAAGRWHVDGLAPGDHRVVVDGGAFVTGGPLDGWTSSPDTGPAPPAADDDRRDVDDGIDPTTLAGDVETGVVSLVPATEPTGEAPGVGATTDAAANDTVDLGFAPLGSLGDRVWLDEDADGVQDPDEPGEPGVSVSVLDGEDVVGRATSGEDGAWSIAHLPAGDYVLAVADGDVPAGLRLVDAGVGDAETDSDVDPATGRSGPVALDWGEDRTDVDVGVTPLRADLAVVKSLDDTPHPADAITWEIAVSNAGPDEEPGPIVVEDAIPATLRFESFTGDGWTCEETAEADVRCEYAAGAAAGGSVPLLELQTEVLGAVGVAVANTATVIGSAVDEDLSDNTSTAARTVVLGRSTLAFTGADTIRLVALAIGLLGVGTLLTVAGSGLLSWQRRRLE